MAISSPGASYVLGGTSREHERLSRQARIFNPFTERLFRNAGISRGQRVLDIGSGVGDVAMLVAQLSGSIIVFQDCYWAPLLQLTASLPLWARCASLIYRAFERSGANINMEHLLYRAFLDAGLPTPKMVIEIPMGDSPDLRRWVYDIFCTLYPQMHEHNLSTNEVGDLESLLSRLETELDHTKSFAACIGLIGAWSQMT